MRKILTDIQILPIFLLFLMSLSAISEMSYSSALPDIASYFAVSKDKAQLTSSFYFIGFMIGILVLGRLSDIIGRRPVIIFGLIFYIIGMVASIFSTNIYIFIAFRFICGICASIGSVVAQSAARDFYKNEELSYIFSITSLGIALGQTFSSLISGYIVEYFGWKYTIISISLWSFLFLIFIFIYLEETNHFIGKKHNYFKIAKKLLLNKKLRLCSIIIGLFNSIFINSYIEIPFIFVHHLNLSPILYSKLIVYMNLSIVLGSSINRYLLKKTKLAGYKIAKIGIIISFASHVLFNLATYITNSNSTDLILAMMPLLFHFIGHGLVVPSVLRYAVEDYPEINGTAGSIFSGLYYIVIVSVNCAVAILRYDNIFDFALFLLILDLIAIYAFLKLGAYLEKINNIK